MAIVTIPFIFLHHKQNKGNFSEIVTFTGLKIASLLMSRVVLSCDVCHAVGKSFKYSCGLVCP